MDDADLFEELLEPVEAAAQVLGVGSGTLLSVALLHRSSALQPLPFLLVLTLATAFTALLHTARSRRAAREPADRAEA